MSNLFHLFYLSSIISPSHINLSIVYEIDRFRLVGSTAHQPLLGHFMLKLSFFHRLQVASRARCFQISIDDDDI